MYRSILPSKLYRLSEQLPLILFLLVGFSVNAQQQETDYVFHIKVAASKTPIPKTAKLYKDFPDVQEVKFPDGFLRYFVGNYETYHRAKDALPSVQEKGYNDAYVVCIHDGKILTGDQAIMEIYGGE